MYVEIYVGTLCVKGENPPFDPKYCPIDLTLSWQKNNFTFNKTRGNDVNGEVELIVQGKEGTKAGDGGDGGKQGNPALAGKIVIFELDQAANIKTQTHNGK